MRTSVKMMLVVCATSCAAMAQIQQLGNGEVVNLGELMSRPVEDRRFQVFDKIFTMESFTSNQFDVNAISVIGFYHLMNPNEYGFDLTGGFGDGTPGSGVIHEFNLQFTVEVAPDYYAQGWRLISAAMLFNGNASGAPGSYARVDETVIDLETGVPIGQMATFDVVRDGEPNDTRLYDELLYGQRRIIEVNKDVKFLAVSSGSTASASFVRQSFGQIPAPGACALLGFAGLVAARRRR